MFTGIVEELGSVNERDGGCFTFGAELVLEDLKVGDSVAVNGCCLTVVDLGEGWWRADVVDESLARTNLADLSAGDPVNKILPSLMIYARFVTASVSRTLWSVTSTPIPAALKSAMIF